jgi:hypothetical protein
MLSNVLVISNCARNFLWDRESWLDVVGVFVKIDESNESWVEVCRRSSKIKSSLRKAKYESDGG